MASPFIGGLHGRAGERSRVSLVIIRDHVSTAQALLVDGGVIRSLSWQCWSCLVRGGCTLGGSTSPIVTVAVISEHDPSCPNTPPRVPGILSILGPLIICCPPLPYPFLPYPTPCHGQSGRQNHAHSRRASFGHTGASSPMRWDRRRGWAVRSVHGAHQVEEQRCSCSKGSPRTGNQHKQVAVSGPSVLGPQRPTAS